MVLPRSKHSDTTRPGARGLPLGIRGKIWLGMGIMLLGYSATMVLGLVSGKHQEIQIKAISSSLFPATQATQQAIAAFERQVKGYEDVVLMGEPEYLDKANAEAKNALDALNRAADAPNLDAQRQDQIQTLSRGIENYTKEASGVYLALSGFDATAEDQIAAKTLSTTSTNLLAGLNNLNNDLGEDLTVSLSGLIANNHRQSKTNMIMFILVLLASTTAIFFIINHWVIGPVVRVMQRLNTDSSRMDESVATVASVSCSMAQGVVQTESNLESTTRAMEEFATQARQNAEAAQTATSMANEANEAAHSSSEAVSQMTDAISKINESSNETAGIIKTIDEIAFQTNLLALNAAVEAARAGDAGKGFAVVAEEVRNLAQRSAQAVKTTSVTLNQSREFAQQGVKAAEDVSRSLSSINETVGKICGIIHDMAEASGHQCEAISGVNTAIGKMQEVTSNTSNSVNHWTSTSECLRKQADGLRGAITVLADVVGSAPQGR